MDNREIMIKIKDAINKDNDNSQVGYNILQDDDGDTDYDE